MGAVRIRVIVRVSRANRPIRRVIWRRAPGETPPCGGGTGETRAEYQNPEGVGRRGGLGEVREGWKTPVTPDAVKQSAMAAGNPGKTNP